MKKIIFSVCIGFFIAASLACTIQKTEAALTGGVIRLHVRANSDSDEDQALKLAVRDRIIRDSKNIFKYKTDIADARSAVEENIEKIKESAESEIAERGYSYPVRIKFGKSDFPSKVYGNLTMPAGTYEALIVEIGSGKGQNWWCVLFPPLCFVDETHAKMSDESKDILIDNLGKDTYKMLESGETRDVEIRFKIYEVWENGKKRFKTMLAQKGHNK